MEVEQSDSFNQKLSQWIASQGFWFQLRHSVSGGGGWSMTFNHLLRLGFKVLVALLVAAGGFGIYLMQRVKTETFAESLNVETANGLGASEAKVVDFARVQGFAQIRRMGVEGGEGTFFRSLDAGNVKFKMGLLDGVVGSWDGGTIQAKWMEIDIKSGADSPDEAKALGDSLFRRWDGFKFSSIDVDEATLRWGFSQRTAGRIERSRLVATRSVNGWQLEFEGGTFSQNWLKKLEIEKLVVECDRSGLKLIKGEFRKGKGRVSFENVAVVGGDQPAVSGTVEISKVDLHDLLPEAVTPFVEGTLSGDFALSGSTNSLEGIQFEGGVTLGEGNVISLRERLDLLKTLSVVDVYNSYRKVDLERGSFHLKTGGGAMELSRVDVRAGDLMTVVGRLEVRYPKDGEISGSLRANLSGQFAPVFDASRADEAGDERRPAGKPAASGGADAADMAIFNRRNQEKVDELLLQEEMARRAQALECAGAVRITIPGDAFDRPEAVELRESFPADPATGRISIEVPLNGPLFELTRRQAEQILSLGTRH